MNSAKKLMNICSLVLLVFILGSCSGFFDNKSSDFTGNNTGLARIYFEIPESEGFGAPGFSRTILPVSTDDFIYDLKFINEAFGIIDKNNEIISSGKYSIDLAVGTWTVEVTRKEKIDSTSEYKPVAWGNAGIEVTPGFNETVKVDLKPIPDGKGIFEYSITLDADSSFLALIKGEISVKSVKNGWVDRKFIDSFPDTGPDQGQISGQWPELDAGEYDVIISLVNTDNNTKTGDHSTAHVYTGMKTTGTFEFSSGHFVDHVNLMGTVDNANNITGIVTPIAVTVTAHIPGTGAVAGESETYPWVAPYDPLTWILSIPPNIPSVYFTVSVEDTDNYVYNHAMKDSPETDIAANGRRSISLSPCIYTIDALVSGNNSVTPSWSSGTVEPRTAASPGEEVFLIVKSDYGMKQGSFRFKLDSDGTEITINSSASPYSFIMREDDVSFAADFYNAELDNLFIIPGNDTLVRTPGKDEYTAVVPNAVDGVQVIGISNEGAAVSVNGPYDNLQTGENEITITVTLVNPAGTVLIGSRDYTLTVTRNAPLSTENRLGSLVLSHDDIAYLELDVSEGDTIDDTITLSVPNKVDQITVTAVPLDPKATAMVIYGDVHDLYPGNNYPIYILVTPESGTQEKTYKINIIRRGPDTLDDISIDLFSLDQPPPFDPDLTKYTATVNVASITVFATATDSSNADVAGTGTYSGLIHGENFIYIDVTPQYATDPEHTKRYTITVTYE